MVQFMKVMIPVPTLELMENILKMAWVVQRLVDIFYMVLMVILHKITGIII